MQNKIYLCSPKKYHGTTPLPMIEFIKTAHALKLDNIDTLLFSSKQAIIFTNELNENWKEKFIIAVGSATANLAKKLGAKNIYYPKEFYGKTLSKDIIQHFKDKKILYPRPKIVSFNHKKILTKYNIEIEEKIIYETKCKKYENLTLEDNSIIIFTSPSTIKCFFKNFNWNSSFKAVVIGETTLKNLPKNIKAFVAEKQTIEHCVKKAIELNKK